MNIRYYIEQRTEQSISFERKTPGASGYDLYALRNVERTLSPTFDEEGCRVLIPGQRWIFPTGIFLEMPIGIEAQIRARSGLSRDHGIVPLAGTIDSDYRGEIQIIMCNLGHLPFAIKPFDRIAQLVFAPVAPECFKLDNPQYMDVARVADKRMLTDTRRGAGGFGSTGVR